MSQPIQTKVLYDAAIDMATKLAVLRKLRAEDPIHWHSANGSDGWWVVTRHADVRALNKDWQRFSSSALTVAGSHAEVPVIMLESDPPVHTQKRRMVHPLFSPRAIERLNDSIAVIAAECIEQFLIAGGGDGVKDLGARVPLRVIAGMLGVPESDQPRLLAWSDDRLGMVPPDARPHRSPAEALNDIFGYAHGLVTRLRAQPSDDVISALLQDPSMPEDEELVDWFRLLVLGGLETTQSLLSGGLLLLLENPDVIETLADDQGLIAGAVEEMLRVISPVQHHRRRVTDLVALHGNQVKPGQLVDLWMLSANHDEEVFESAELFKVDRDPNPHLSFGGGGPHYCLGAYLSRAEGIAFFKALIPHMSRLRLAGSPIRLASSHFNSLADLPLEVD